MLARSLRWMLAVEIALYVLLGRVLVSAGWSVAAAVALGAATFAGWRLAIVLLSFALSRRSAPGRGVGATRS